MAARLACGRQQGTKLVRPARPARQVVGRPLEVELPQRVRGIQATTASETSVMTR